MKIWYFNVSQQFMLSQQLSTLFLIRNEQVLFLQSEKPTRCLQRKSYDTQNKVEE